MAKKKSRPLATGVSSRVTGRWRCVERPGESPVCGYHRRQGRLWTWRRAAFRGHRGVDFCLGHAGSVKRFFSPVPSTVSLLT